MQPGKYMAPQAEMPTRNPHLSGIRRTRMQQGMAFLASLHRTANVAQG